MTTTIFGIPVVAIDVMALPTVVLDENKQALASNEIPFMLPNKKIVWINLKTFDVDEQSRMKCIQYLSDQALEKLRYKPRIDFGTERLDLNDQIMWRARMRYGFQPPTVSYVVPTGDLS